MPAQCSTRRGESDLGFGSESDGEEEEGKEERKEGRKEGGDFDCGRRRHETG